MLTFFGEPQLKKALLLRLEGHRIADEFMQGTYWQKGRGCFIGCAVHGDEADKFETQFGISICVAKLGEYFFERFPAAKAKGLPIEIITAIPVGADSAMVWPRFWHWLATDPIHGLLALPLPKAVADIIRQVDTLYDAWPNVDWKAMAQAAEAVVQAARAAQAAGEVGAVQAAGAVTPVTKAAEAVAQAVWAARAARAAEAVAQAAWAARAVAGTAEAVEVAWAAWAAWAAEILSAQYTAFLTILRGLGEPADAVD